MTEPAFKQPVGDTVPKINEEVAVGEDLEFQRRWWKFERVVWVIFAVLIVLDVAGVFGAGPAANAQIENPMMHVDYERIERATTPSMLRIHFSPAAVEQGKIRLFVSDSVVNELGNQRVIPSPESSAVGNGGITYTFPATGAGATVAFALEPTHASVTPFTLQVPNTPAVHADVLVLP